VRLIAVIAAAAGVALLVASPSSGDSPRPIVDPSLENADGYELIVEYAEQAGIPDDWRDFLLAKAWIESRGNPLKGRGITDGAPSNAQIVSSSSEAAAAAKAYDRQVERGAIVGSVWGRKSWSFGSGGLFAMLPANAVVVAYRGTDLQGVAEAYDPWSVFEPKKAIALAIAYNRSLAKWQGFRSDPTWENLHAGWRAPGNMGSPGSTGYQKSAANFREALAAMGLPASFASKRVNFDGVPDAVQVYLALNGAGSV
jgi:hypothetical protein